MEIQSRQKFIPAAWERLINLPAYVELCVPGGFLLFVSGVFVVLVIYLLCGGFPLLSVRVADGG